MGLFSWTSSASGKSICAETNVVLVLNNGTTVIGEYNGYGEIQTSESLFSIYNWLASANGKADPDNMVERLSGIYMKEKDIQYPIKILRAGEYYGQLYHELDPSRCCKYQGSYYEGDPEAEEDQRYQ